MKKINLIVWLAILVITGCSKGKSVPPIPGDHGQEAMVINENFFETSDKIYPVNPHAPFAQKASECIYQITSETSCLISELPMLGLSAKPTVQAIMDRTLVTHDFLAESFRQVLMRLNPETLEMFGAVSAIVISDKINPSFYLNKTGAIYLSGSYFWTTEAEKKIVTKVRDFREGNGTYAVPFIDTADYVYQNNSVYDQQIKGQQNYDEMTRKVSILLFHELAHANDYFEPAFYKSTDLNKEKSYDEIAYERYSTNQIVSQRQPVKVKSKILSDIGQIFYQGAEIGEGDKAVTSAIAANEFINDVASDFYAYSTPREDLAMLVEESLMLTYYQIPRYVAFIGFPHADFTPPMDYVNEMTWAQKSRIADPAIKDRAVYAVLQVFNKVVAQRVKARLDATTTKTYPAMTDWNELYR